MIPSKLARILAAALVAVATAAVLAVGSAPAGAAFFAESSDPAGDATSPDPGHDITGVGLGYDRRTGQLVGAIQLRGEPGDVPAFVTLVAAATRAGASCGGAAVGFSAYTDDFDARWHRFASPAETTASGDASTQGYRAAAQRFEVTDRRLRGLRPKCVQVVLTEPGNAQNVYDVAGPLRVELLPSLAVKLGGVPEDVRAGRTHRLKVTVSNPGDAPTAKVKLRLASVRGMTAPRRTATLKRIPAGGRRTATFDVRFGARASFSNELKVTATAGRLAATADRRVYVSQPDRGGRGRGGGGGGRDDGGGTPGVCTQWFPDFSGETGGSLGLVPCLH